ncbi:hypothetical protein E1B28_002038 [Marasmius oreades]|uniref:Glycoside hydrolase family 76 protein n=1 Tax=Marasmius oreades TaxID=181124 RepID=A0A9P7V4Q6_9AGAR|nr:uncharacterized protein E1B28_002038 [Marasmius oreades]KAG7100265.1 hypothetical protein E1B28_002038 [Marasmius oreades]
MCSLYGYAASKAYTAYQDDSFLKLAQECWNLTWTYFISDEVIESGRIATKSLPLQRSCFDAGIETKSFLSALRGGVFQTFNHLDGEVDAAIAGAFLILSALLAESTLNDTYVRAATLTLEFVPGFLNEQRTPCGLDDNMTTNCYTFSNDRMWYPTTGDLIEGLSILTSTNSSLALNLQAVLQTETLLRQDQRPDGILDIGPNYIPDFPTGNPFLVRGIVTAYRRNLTAELSDFVKTFIDIQYNAILENTAAPGTNIYGGSWIGPPKQSFDPINQTYAAMVLVQAIGLVPSPTNVNTSGSTTTTTGTIVGSIVGGVTFIAIITGLILLLLLKRKHSRQGPFSILASSTPSVFITSHPPSTYGITPFMLPEPWEMDVAPKPAKAIVSHSTNIQPAADELPDPGNPIQCQSIVDQLEVEEAISCDGDNFDSRFQAMTTAHMIRILNECFESESLPPTYQSQLGSST